MEYDKEYLTINIIKKDFERLLEIYNKMNLKNEKRRVEDTKRKYNKKDKEINIRYEIIYDSAPPYTFIFTEDMYPETLINHISSCSSGTCRCLF